MCLDNEERRCLYISRATVPDSFVLHRRCSPNRYSLCVTHGKNRFYYLTSDRSFCLLWVDGHSLCIGVSETVCESESRCPDFFPCPIFRAKQEPIILLRKGCMLRHLEDVPWTLPQGRSANERVKNLPSHRFVPLLWQEYYFIQPPAATEAAHPEMHIKLIYSLLKNLQT